MPQPRILFDGVWKKFRRGEHHDSLRDLIPAIARRLVGGRAKDALTQDEFWVLRDLSFEVKPGQALGIIGPNGAGKSTTLKLLTKILKPTRGSALVSGRVGALIEVAAGFHPDLTGRENVFLQGAIMGMSQNDIRARFDAIVAFAGIEPFIDTPVKRYSSGMNARLGFAIAAHLDPEVLLIDEVLAVGDFTFQQRCYERLQEFRRSGVPIAFVSHNMQAIASLCDRALLLRSNEPGVLGDVPTVLSQYVASRGAVSDPRLTVEEGYLYTAGLPLTGPVAPGCTLEYVGAVRVKERFPRCGVALQVVRSDGLEVFTGLSTLDGGSEVEINAGDLLQIRISFTANVLRGTYIVNLLLVDTLRQWPTATVSGAGSFVVNETTRIAGCAELSPSYEISAAAPGDDVPHIMVASA